MIEDSPAAYLRCGCGYARWFQLIPAQDNQLELVEAPRWWHECLGLLALIAVIVAGSGIVSFFQR
jgi:hypothetical protein